MARKRPLGVSRRRGTVRPERRRLPTAPATFDRAMGTVYAIANQKGGVGKTTTAVNVAACIAEAGYETLLVDVDPQANATVGLGLPQATRDPSVYDVLAGEATAAEARRGRPTIERLVAARRRRPTSPAPTIELPRLPGSETAPARRARAGARPLRLHRCSTARRRSAR